MAANRAARAFPPPDYLGAGHAGRVHSQRRSDLLAQAQRLQREALGVLEVAKTEGNLGGVLQAIDRLQKGIGLLATLAATQAETDNEITIRWVQPDELEEK